MSLAADSAATAKPSPKAHPPWRRRRSAIPGFGLTPGVALTALSLVVLIPLSAVAIKSASLSPAEFRRAAFSERALLFLD